MKVSYEIVRDRFNYNEETGWLTWKNNYFKSKNGTRAGSLSKSTGYRVIKINNKLYQEHRIIWLWCKGFDTENQIDHINRIRNDNRISNIREATPSCNMKNIGLKSNNKTGITGVFETKDGKFLTRIQDSEENRIYLGIFDTLLEAVKARYLSEVEYNYENCNLTSTALKFIKDNDPEWLNSEMKVERIKSNKTSNIKGISFNKRDNIWMPYININKKRKYLGSFIELDEAVIVKYKAEVKYKQTKNSKTYDYLIERNLI